MQVGDNMKKFFVILLMIATFFVIETNVFAIGNEYVNANGIKISKKEYNNLLSMAFSEEDIYLMSQEEFDNNKDKVGIKTIKEVSYIKTVATKIPKKDGTNILNNDFDIIYKDYYLTEDQMKQELSRSVESNKLMSDSSSTTETTYKKLTASITSFMGSEGWMYYRSRADLEWLKMPAITSQDKIRVHVTDGFMSERDTRYGVQIAKKNGKIETVNYKNDSSKWEIDKPENEEILNPNLINGSVTERRIYMYFDAFQYYPDNYYYFRAEAGYNHNTLTGWDGWMVTTADLEI